MARFCWCLVGLTLIFTSTVIGQSQRLFPGRCGMSHPCAQICRDVPGMPRVRCECESGHILASNGFLCISEKEDTINIDEETSQKVTEAPVVDEQASKSPEPLGSGAAELEEGGSGSGTDEDQSSGDILVPSPMAVCDEFHCQNGGTCFIIIMLNKPFCQCPVGYDGVMCDKKTEKSSPSCEGFECRNGGTCYINIEENKEACHCLPGYKGEVCEKKTLPSCEGFECHNGGTCYINMEENKRACRCLSGYEGEVCDIHARMEDTINIDEEASQNVTEAPVVDEQASKSPEPLGSGAAELEEGGSGSGTDEDQSSGDILVPSPMAVCDEFHCQNGGTCFIIVMLNKPFCQCPVGYDGVMCDKKTEKSSPSCEGFECRNGGTCYINIEENKEACHCLPGYKGEVCEKKTLPSCEGFECHNGGTCYINMEENKRSCRCLSGYEGEVCDIHARMGKPLPSCQGFVCHNDGTCFINLEMNKPVCHCPHGFEGENCETSPKIMRPSCEIFECQNGGTCYIDDELKKAMCRCATGYEGETCSISATTPRPLCEGFECQNGGICYINNKTGSAMCRCQTGFEGDVCDEIVQKPPSSCQELVCGNGGSCYMNQEIAMCHCPLGYQGDTCEQTVSIKFPSFQSHSYMEFPTPQGLYRSFQIQLDFKPESLNGLLLFCGEQDNTQSDYFSVGLLDGRMQFKYELGGTAPGVITSSVVVSLGKWHTVTVNRDHWDGWIQVDEEKPVKGKSKGLYSKLTLRNPLYLGGHPDYSSLSETGHNVGFSGCVERLVINNADHDMRPQPRGFAVAGVDVGECSSGLCDEGMCSNGGSCVAQSASRYLCLCPLGTAGPTCEKDVLLHIPSFNGSSHLVHQSLGKNHLSFLEIEVIFRPHEPTGVLLYSGQKFQRTGDFVSLGMSDGHVEFRFDCGSGAAVLRTTEPISLNEWHIAVASRTARDGTLKVDKRRIIGGMAEGAFTQLTFAGDLYIGGVEDPAHIARNSEMGTSFIGDIQKVIHPSNRTTSYQVIANSASYLFNDDQYSQWELSNIDSNVDNIRIYGAHKSVQQDTPGAVVITAIRELPESPHLIWVIINDKPLDLIDDAIRGANVLNADHPCVGRPCQNRGECAAQHATYSCQCPLWYEGINCEQEIEEIVEVPSFQGSSYLRLSSNWISNGIGGKTTNDIQLEFRSWSSDGLILWAGCEVMTSSSDFMALGLDNGMLKWSYNLGSGPVSVTTNRTLNDGEWHRVSLQRDSASGTLVVDGREGVMVTAPGLATSLNINNGLFLGGMKDIAELSLQRYSIGLLGCIRNVVLETVKLNLYRHPTEGRNVNHCA